MESIEGFATVEAGRNGIELLKIFRLVSYGFESHKDRMLAYAEALKGLITLRQGEQQSLQDFKKQFEDRVAVCEAVGEKLALPKTLIDLIVEENTRAGRDETTDEVVHETAYQRMLARLFLLGVDQARYGGMFAKLENDHSAGDDKYPHTVDATYNRLRTW